MIPIELPQELRYGQCSKCLGACSCNRAEQLVICSECGAFFDMNTMQPLPTPAEIARQTARMGKRVGQELKLVG